jgi:CIC family chloride channel protein
MRLPKWTACFQPVAGGLTVGLIGYFVPEVLGVGYNHVEKVLNGDIVLKVVVLLAVLKIVATAVCYASGNAGGIFGPALFIGAMMGASVGGVAHTLFPSYTAGPGAYALVGMGTAFAGIVRTPLTSVFMIFEITRDYTIIVPLMISNLIAYFISYKLQKQPIYEALARQEGVHLPTAHSRALAERMQVSEAMRSPSAVLSPDLLITMVLRKMKAGEFDAWPVGDAEGVWGMIRSSELEQAADDGASNQKVAVILREGSRSGHSTTEDPPYVHPDQSLSLALEQMGTSGLNVLPVVSRANVHQLVGIIALDDILNAYGVAKRGSSMEPND